MKDLTYDELSKAPPRIAFLYAMALTDQPVGLQTIETAMKDHPEYFPDELEYRRKYNLIPQSVHDAYFEEYGKLREEMLNELPPSKGIIYWCDHPKEYKEWNEAYDRISPQFEVKEKELHRKHYSEYGI